MTIFDDLYNILLKPIVDAFGNVLRPITDAINPQKIIDSFKGAEATYKAGKPTKSDYFKGKSPLTPEEAHKAGWDYAAAVEPGLLALNLFQISAEAGTLGQVDMTLQNLNNLPYVQDDYRIATAVRTAEFLEGAYPAIQRYYRKKLTPLIPETYRLALAAVRGLLSDADYSNSMSESGLESKWADMWKEQNYEYPAFAQLTELFWRGVIDDATFTMWMQRSGVRPNVIDALKSLREMIPPAQDLVTMVVREAFDPKFVTAAPAVFAKYMAMKGFSSEWSDRYWTMHWRPMPIEQGYDNLRRGYWTKEEFIDLLRIADVHPMWREDIYNVAFNPPSIRELGYGYDVGAYSLEDIVKYRRWGGLSEEDANKAASAMVAYRTEAERNSVRTEYMYLYGRGKITRADFESKITELGTPAPAIALWLERADAYRERITAEPTPEEPPSMTRSVAQWLFENGVRDEVWLRAALKTLGYFDATIDDFVAQSKFKIEEAKAKKVAVTYRELTATQIRDLYRQRKLTAEQLPAEFEKLKYSPDDAKRLSDILIQTEALPAEPNKLSRAEIVNLYEVRLLGLTDAEMKAIMNNMIITEGPKSPTKALYGEYIALGYDDTDAVRLTVWTAIDVTLPTLKAVYSKGWISALQLYDGIREIGIPDDKANEIMMTIIKAEQPQRTAPEKDLTKAEIIKGAKAGILSPNQASSLLQGIGYDENEALYLLYINAVVARGDPEGYWEMRKVIEQQKKARGETSVNIPDELIMLELQIKNKKAEIEKLKADKASEEALGLAAVALANLESNMRVMLGKLKLA